MDFGDLDSTAAHDTARATAMTAHPSSRMSIVCSGGKASTCNDSNGATPESRNSREDTYPDSMRRCPANTGGDRRHESGFDGELCDDPHLVDAEGQKRAYLMDA